MATGDDYGVCGSEHRTQDQSLGGVYYDDNYLTVVSPSSENLNDTGLIWEVETLAGRRLKGADRALVEIKLQCAK